MDEIHRRGITIKGAFAEDDRMLARAALGVSRSEFCCEDLTLKQVNQLRVNKLAAWVVNSTPDQSQWIGSQDTRTEIERQRKQTEQWSETLAYTVNLFERINIRYVLMKALASPCALMSDLDFLIPFPEDIARLAYALEKANFALYRFRLLAHPLKIMAVPVGETAASHISIDIYPDGMWIRKHVIDGLGVLARRQPGTIRGIAAWLPSDEDNLYLVATHAFHHGRLSLAELDHGFRILAQNPAFDWERTLRRAIAFGCIDGFYTYVSVLSQLTTQLALQEVIPPALLHDLRGFPVTRPIQHWLNQCETLVFPLQLPVLICTVRSALYHLPGVRHRITLREYFCDAMTHGITFVTHATGRD